MKQIMIALVFISLTACTKEPTMGYICFTPVGALDTAQVPGAKISRHKDTIRVENDALVLEVTASNCLGVIRK